MMKELKGILSKWTTEAERFKGNKGQQLFQGLTMRGMWLWTLQNLEPAEEEGMFSSSELLILSGNYISVVWFVMSVKLVTNCVYFHFDLQKRI